MTMSTNGGPGQTPPQETQPQLTVVSQYIKDFSFENPNAPQSLTSRQEQPQIGIQINVGANPLSDSDIEVSIKLEGKAEVGRRRVIPFRPGLRWCFSHPKCSTRKPEPRRADRMPTVVVSVCARDHRDRRTQRRLSSASA